MGLFDIFIKGLFKIWFGLSNNIIFFAKNPK